MDIVRYTGTSGSQIHTAVDIVVSSSGLLDLNGFTDDIGDITLNGGDITLGTGTLTLAGNVGVTSSSSVINGPTGALSLSGTRTFTVDSGRSFDLQAPVAGAGALNKAGTGTLRLGYPGTYTGLTTVQALGMTLLVYAGSAQLAALPLLAESAPLSVIFLTAAVVNLRFVIFSAALQPYFGHFPVLRRALLGYFALW